MPSGWASPPNKAPVAGTKVGPTGGQAGCFFPPHTTFGVLHVVGSFTDGKQAPPKEVPKVLVSFGEMGARSLLESKQPAGTPKPSSAVWFPADGLSWSAFKASKKAFSIVLLEKLIPGNVTGFGFTVTSVFELTLPMKYAPAAPASPCSTEIPVKSSIMRFTRRSIYRTEAVMPPRNSCSAPTTNSSLYSILVPGANGDPPPPETSSTAGFAAIPPVAWLRTFLGSKVTVPRLFSVTKFPGLAGPQTPPLQFAVSGAK